jgi:hypothetical protein
MKAQFNLNTVIGGLLLLLMTWVGTSIKDLGLKVARIEASNIAKVEQIQELKTQIKELKATMIDVQLDLARIKSK